MERFPADPESQSRLLAAIRLVATDVDGTLTTGRSLSGAVVDAIERLTAAGVEVLPVSGRAAGEVLGLVRYLPGVVQGIAENGQVVVEPDRPLRWLATPTDREALRRAAREIAGSVGEELELAPDAFCRVGDVAFERAGRDDARAARIAAAAQARGLYVIWSSVHIHFSTTEPDKGRALERVLGERGVPQEHVLAIGDAPNDAGLFVAGRFGVSVGTADVRMHAAHMASLPGFVCDAREGAAFAEVAQAISRARGAV